MARNIDQVYTDNPLSSLMPEYLLYVGAATDGAISYEDLLGQLIVDILPSPINNGVYVTDGSGATSVSTTLPSGLTIPGYATTASLSAYALLSGAVFTGSSGVEVNASNSTANFDVFNTATSGSSSNANLNIITRQNGGGDPATIWSIVGSPTVTYYAGIDNTDDTWKIGIGSAVGSNVSASINNSTGAWTLPGDFNLNGSQANGITLNINNSSTASANSPYSRILLQTLQAGGADPYITFLAAGSPQVVFSMGIDNTDDLFKITRNFSLGTADFSIDPNTGVATFAQTVSANISGNAATVTTVPALSGAISTTGSTNVTSYSGIVPTANGGNNANNAATSGTQLRGNGAAFVPSTTTYPDTNAINTIPYASSANVMGSISAANNGVLQTSATGVPSISTRQTYTPTIGDGTNNFTTSTAEGNFYRMGWGTFYTIKLVWTGKGSASAGSAIRVSLNAASGSNPTANPFYFGFVNGITSTTQIMSFNNAGDNFLHLVNFTSGGSANDLLVSSFATSGQIQLSGWVGN